MRLPKFPSGTKSKHEVEVTLQDADPAPINRNLDVLWMIILRLVAENSPSSLFCFTAANPTAFFLLTRHGHTILVDRITRAVISYFCAAQFTGFTIGNMFMQTLLYKNPFIDPVRFYWDPEIWQLAKGSAGRAADSLFIDEGNIVDALHILLMIVRGRNCCEWVSFGRAICRAGGLAGRRENWPDRGRSSWNLRMVDRVLRKRRREREAAEEKASDEVFRRRFFGLSRPWI